MNESLSRRKVNLRDTAVTATRENTSEQVIDSNRRVAIMRTEMKDDRWLAIKSRVRKLSIERGGELFDDVALHEDDIHRVYREVIAEQRDLTEGEKKRLLDEMADYTFGWGLIEQLMDDKDITEVMIDAPDRIWYRRNGIDYQYTDDYPEASGRPISFGSGVALEEWLQNLIKYSERTLNYEEPLIDDDLPGGARLEATWLPVSEYPTVNIRKSVKQTRRYKPEEWVEQNVWSQDMVDWLLKTVAAYANIVICGPTGTGKTTVIRMLIENGASPNDRIILIEDIRETNAEHPRFLSLRVVERKNNPITHTDLFAAAMRKTPTRVFVSELRKPPETVAFLETIGSGHSGAMTSQHGDEPRMVLNTMIARAVQGGWGAIPEIVREMVFEAVQILVFIMPIDKNMRRVTRVVEVVPMHLWDRYGRFRDIFRWNPKTDEHEWLTDPISEHLEKWEFADRVHIPRKPKPILRQREDIPHDIR